MTDIQQVLTEEIHDIQRAWRTSKIALPNERWFTTVKLETATIEGDTITFVWRDPADGQRHGWRWHILPDALDVMMAHLDEDLETTEPTEPDEHGIRWWGVRHVL